MLGGIATKQIKLWYILNNNRWPGYFDTSYYLINKIFRMSYLYLSHLITCLLLKIITIIPDDCKIFLRVSYLTDFYITRGYTTRISQSIRYSATSRYYINIITIFCDLKNLTKNNNIIHEQLLIFKMFYLIIVAYHFSVRGNLSVQMSFIYEFVVYVKYLINKVV